MAEHTRDHLEAAFWAQIAARYPATCWWWSPTMDNLELFPEWSAAAYEREASIWRQLAQQTDQPDYPEIEHWGRFARLVATRIQLGCFRDASEPLRHASTVMRVAQLLDPGEERYPRARLLERMVSWLSGIVDVGARGFWIRTRLASEGSLLRQHLVAMPRPQAMESIQWTILIDRVRSAIQAYQERVQGYSRDESSAPWMASAHGSVDDWRARRLAMMEEKPILVSRPMIRGDLLNGSDFKKRIFREIVVSGLRGWWVHPHEEGDQLIHGDSYDPSISLGMLLILWRQKSRLKGLTWALTSPAVIEGGLMLLTRIAGETMANWAPVHTGFLDQWRQRRRAMAAVDAWLWLEGGDADEALGWLRRFVGKAEAVALIPWMKTHPGFYVMSQRVMEVLWQDAGGVGGEYSVWTRGPLMPHALFVAPDQPAESSV